MEKPSNPWVLSIAQDDISLVDSESYKGLFDKIVWSSVKKGKNI